MTRKDYILIAAALKNAREVQPEASLGIDVAAWHMCESLARDNPRFDRERFLKAAGVVS